MADLVKGSSLDLASKLEPKVTSLAHPSTDFLLQARADVQRDPELQALFRQFQEHRLNVGYEVPEQKDEAIEALGDQLASRLAGLWGGNFTEALEAARYLADEYSQIGEGILIVSSQTGKVIAKLDEKDLYQPAPVPRESGGLALPLPRIEPGLEAMIVSWVFEKGREERIETLLAERAEQTALLREEGDRRLWIATRKGRAALAHSLSEDHPMTLLSRSGGTAGSFLRHFDLALQPPESSQATRAFYRLETTMALRVHDPLTTNLRYDRLGSMRGVVVQGWVRDLGRQIAEDAHRRIPLPRVIQAEEITKSWIQTSETWVADPDVLLAFLKVGRGIPVLPVNGAPTIGLKGKLGTIVVPEIFEVQNREIFGRWEVLATLDVQVYIPDWTQVTVAVIQGLAITAQVL